MKRPANCPYKQIMKGAARSLIGVLGVLECGCARGKFSFSYSSGNKSFPVGCHRWTSTLGLVSRPWTAQGIKRSLGTVSSGTSEQGQVTGIVASTDDGNDCFL